MQLMENVQNKIVAEFNGKRKIRCKINANTKKEQERILRNKTLTENEKYFSNLMKMMENKQEKVVAKNLK